MLCDSKVHGDNMGPIWGRQDPGGPHVGPITFVIWEMLENTLKFFFFKILHTHVLDKILLDFQYDYSAI